MGAEQLGIEPKAVHSDLEASRSIYDFVLDVCVKIGASRDELVPVEKYVAAAESLRSEHFEDVVSWTDGGPATAGDDNQRVEASQPGRCRLEGA